MQHIDIGDIAIEAFVAGEGPPLLFLHGGDYFLQHQAFFDRLARRRHLVVPRHPGFGSTKRPDWLRTVHDIAYLYLDLVDKLDLARTVLVGAGFGGWVALEMCVRSTARVARLALIDSVGVRFAGPAEREIADIYALPAEEVARRTFFDPAQVVPDYAKLDQAELEVIARDREATVRYGWKPYMHDPALRHWLHRVTVPTLVLWGEQDGVVAPAYGERLAAALPDARFRTIARAGHYPQVERPDETAEVIERFAAGEDSR